MYVPVPLEKYDFYFKVRQKDPYVIYIILRNKHSTNINCLNNAC